MELYLFVSSLIDIRVSVKVKLIYENYIRSLTNMDLKKLDEKTKRWRQLQHQRFQAKKRHGYTQPQKEPMPPEHLRKVSRI